MISGARMSQKKIILEMLKSGEEVTPLTCFLKAKSLRTSERIRELTDDGWDIVSQLVHRGDKVVALYKLVPEEAIK